MALMTIYDVVDELRSEGIDVSVDQLRYAIRKGYIRKPSRLDTSVMVFDRRNLRPIRRYFLVTKRPPGRPKGSGTKG